MYLRFCSGSNCRTAELHVSVHMLPIIIKSFISKLTPYFSGVSNSVVKTFLAIGTYCEVQPKGGVLLELIPKNRLFFWFSPPAMCERTQLYTVSISGVYSYTSTVFIAVGNTAKASRTKGEEEITTRCPFSGCALIFKQTQEPTIKKTHCSSLFTQDLQSKLSAAAWELLLNSSGYLASRCGYHSGPCVE